MPRPSKRHVPHESTLETAIDDAANAIEELHGEMEEQCDNMESNEMEHLPRYETISQTRDSLDEAMQYAQEAQSEITNMRSDVQSFKVEYTQDERKAAWSRPGRRDNIDSLLAGIIESIDEKMGEIEDTDFNEDEAKEEEAESIKCELDEIRQSIESAQSSLQEAEFPGMFG